MSAKLAFQELGAAISSNDTTRVSQFLQQHAHALRAESRFPFFLDYAARTNRPEILALLVAAGAEVNTPREGSGPEGPLFSAAACGAIDSVRWLVTHGADLNVSHDGKPVCLSLYASIAQNFVEIARLLLDYGAITDSIWNGDTPLQFAVRNGNTKLAELISSHVERSR